MINKLKKPIIHKSIIFSATRLPTKKLKFISFVRLDKSFALPKSPALNGRILFKKYPMCVVDIYWLKLSSFGESRSILHLKDLSTKVIRVIKNARKI